VKRKFETGRTNNFTSSSGERSIQKKKFNDFVQVEVKEKDQDEEKKVKETKWNRKLQRRNQLQSQAERNN
jgi:hypothetical protein